MGMRAKELLPHCDMQHSRQKTGVIFSETYLPLLGGAEMYTYNFAKQLTLRGYTITILTHTGGEPPEEYQVKGVTVIHVPKISKYQPFAVLSLFLKMTRLVRQSDLVCANYTYSLSTLAVLAGIIARKPIIVFAHGLGTIIDATHPKIYRLYRYVTLRLAHKVVTTSEEIADIVRRYTREVLVATAVDCSAIDASLDASRVAEIQKEFDGRKIIVTTRRLVEKNGIQYLIEALPFLLKKQIDFVYIVIGDGRLYDELSKRVNELGLQSRVRFLGALQNNLVFNYIKAADVAVFPSSAEALSLAAIEVMHIGTPLVVSNIGGLRELVGVNAERGTTIDLFGRIESVYTAPDAHSLSTVTYEHFAEQLVVALSCSEDVAHKSVLAKEFVDARFDWLRVANAILQFIA